MSVDTSSVVIFGADVLERMVLAVEKVRERLERATSALQAAGLRYAVIGGNAVAAWVSRTNPAAVRNTSDVDLLVTRDDFDAIRTALESVGFYYRHAARVDMFLDGPKGNPREAVHIVFANEKVRPEYEFPAPDLSLIDAQQSFIVIGLEPLVRMKLTSFRDKDRTHLRDMIDVGILDPSWLPKLPTSLARRLESLLDTPEG